MMIATGRHRVSAPTPARKAAQIKMFFEIAVNLPVNRRCPGVMVFCSFDGSPREDSGLQSSLLVCCLHCSHFHSIAFRKHSRSVRPGRVQHTMNPLQRTMRFPPHSRLAPSGRCDGSTIYRAGRSASISTARASSPSREGRRRSDGSVARNVGKGIGKHDQLDEVLASM